MIRETVLKQVNGRIMITYIYFIFQFVITIIVDYLSQRLIIQISIPYSFVFDMYVGRHIHYYGDWLMHCCLIQ